MSNIEWTEKTWNPVVGCSKVSEGCRNCYAMTMSRRIASIADANEARHKEGTGSPPTERLRAYQAVVKRDAAGLPLPQWNNRVVCIDSVLTEPMRWRKPATVFVNSMGDLFHEDVPFAFIDRVFAVMALCPRHTFQVLTKRPGRMLEYFESRPGLSIGAIGDVVERAPKRVQDAGFPEFDWPLPNVWLGTSAEDQATADERIPMLLRCPAAVRYVSCEPLLGRVDLDAREYLCRSWIEKRFTIGTYLDWIIVGGESGPGARPCDVKWIRSVVEQCCIAGTPVFVKQLGANVRDRNDAGFDGGDDDAWDLDVIRDIEDNPDHECMVYQGRAVRVRLNNRKGGDMAEWPGDLRVREMPGVRARPNETPDAETRKGAGHAG